MTQTSKGVSTCSNLSDSPSAAPRRQPRPRPLLLVSGAPVHARPTRRVTMMASKKLEDEASLPQGKKNWEQKPQQVDGPNGPEVAPLPVDAGAGEANSKKKPQQVDGPV